jgi:glutamate racemase
MSDGEPTATGKLVATVYSTVLGVSAEETDDFFELGGHSMLAVLAIGELSAAVGVALPVRLIFDHPTVCELAAVIEDRVAAAADSG